MSVSSKTYFEQDHGDVVSKVEAGIPILAWVQKELSKYCIVSLVI